MPDFGEKPEGRSLVLPVVTGPEIVKVGNKGSLVDTKAQKDAMV